MSRRRPTGPSTLDLGARVLQIRRLVMARMARSIEEAGADEDDVMQDVWVRLLQAQRSQRSGYDPGRGMSATTYLTTVGVCAARNSLRAFRLHRGRTDATDPEDLDQRHEARTEEPVTEASVERVLAFLDLDVERQVARLLAQGCTSAEIQRELGISEGDAAELRDRVRALLLPLRDEGQR